MTPPHRFRFWFGSFVASLTFAVSVVRTHAWAVQADSTEPIAQSCLNEIVLEAFVKVYDGYSADEVLLQDGLQSKFLDACREQDDKALPNDLNWTLLNLRKQGKLKAYPTRKRNRVSLDGVRFVSEIAARSIQDAHKISIDRAFCDPELRSEFDKLAHQLAEDVDLYAVRKAALQLRKARQLQPELITRIADWGRVVTHYSPQQIKDDPTAIPEEPGIYIFSDRQGYLYIGESDNLRRRLTEHLDESDRKSLAAYLKTHLLEGVSIEVHTFAPDSRIKELAVRRAYESELIRSRNPRLNIRP